MWEATSSRVWLIVTRRSVGAGGIEVPKMVYAIQESLVCVFAVMIAAALAFIFCAARSEEHTSELQSRLHLVCRLLLEKKKKQVLRKTNSHLCPITGHEIHDHYAASPPRYNA